MFLFYSPDINTDIITLSKDESAHCLRVLRLKTKDIINLTDGKGNLYEAALLDENIKGCTLKIIKHILRTTNCEPRTKLHIAVAPTKNIARFEWFLEKSTEIGIDIITPLICERSERKTINNERLNKIIISSLKQSLNTYLPVLNPAINFKDFIKTTKYELRNTNYELFIAVCDETMLSELPTPNSQLPTLNSHLRTPNSELQTLNSELRTPNSELRTTYTKGKDCIILIGPEGDFSKAEIQLAIDNGFIPVNLSKNRLRTETAALMACTIINILND